MYYLANLNYDMEEVGKAEELYLRSIRILLKLCEMSNKRDELLKFCYIALIQVSSRFYLIFPSEINCSCKCCFLVTIILHFNSVKVYMETGNYEREMEYRTVLEEWKISRDARAAQQVQHSVPVHLNT